MMNKSEFYKIALNKYKNQKLFNTIINIIMVVEKVRPSCLFETGDFKHDIEPEFFDIINTFNNQINANLQIEQDNFQFPRYLIFIKNSKIAKSLKNNSDIINNDKFLAESLGFQCIGHDYSNYNLTRISVEYTESNTNEIFMVELCELNKKSLASINKTANDLNSRFNKVLNPLNYNSICTIKTIEGTLFRYLQLQNKNYSYIIENSKDYISDFENYYISDEKVFQKSGTFKNLVNLNPDNITKLTEIYKIAIIDDKFTKCYENTNNHTQIEDVAKKILKLDLELWEKN